jgi:hypothetical protein
VHDLESNGFVRDQISVVAAGSTNVPGTDTPNVGPIENIGSDTEAGTGAAVGSLAGFLAGMVALAIPGVGPIIAAGPLAAGLMGAGIGAAAGGITGALRKHGIPEEQAGRYSAAVGRGGCMVVVHADEARVDRAVNILDREGAINIHETEQPADTATSRSRQGAVEAAKLKPGEGVRDRQRENERRVSVYPGITGGGPTLTS